ncbi:MAG: Phosphomannomutase [Candidatus Roizmanbacteria bacterium GW2011_GWA2_37_7]|uniref:Phosphomannomutase n=1 Tax=Candidatus Roizmanbacteria bacterium GW2011_GWA2_37_7 TaxID=1618481 RepID=A0A0G0H113_9BACT|nr:MAG: Phosphomannomutase [Candidatus Roizmanbacteria bacterium GW2011_GWA2_37_7]
MTIIDTSIFQAYDIRGVYPKQINENVMENITRAIFTFFKKRLKKTNMTIVLGHDMRLSSPVLHQIACDTLKKCGAQVIDIGLAATPTVYFAVRNDKYDAGIQISASHNPKEYNGIKIVIRNADALIKIGKNTGMNSIVNNVQHSLFSEYTAGGSVIKQENTLEKEIDQAIQAVHSGDVHTLKIVVDPANAMGILPTNELFDRLGATLIKINFDLDGTFPSHQADPLQHKTLRDLQKRVKDTKAHLGIALDGDADRVMFIDERGEIVPATLITTLIAGEILKENPGERILVDIRYIKNVEDMVTKLGGKVGYTKIGHALITEQVNNEHAIFAGESSGHYYFRSMGGCESTVRVILFILRVLSRENKPFSKILEKIQTSVESGESNFILPVNFHASIIINKLKTMYADGVLSELDGVAISYPEWRFSVRTSNTEALLRLNVEGKTNTIVMTKLNDIRKMILEYGSKLRE